MSAERCRFCLQKAVYWDKQYHCSFCHNCGRDATGRVVAWTAVS